MEERYSLGWKKENLLSFTTFLAILMKPLSTFVCPEQARDYMHVEADFCCIYLSGWGTACANMCNLCASLIQQLRWSMHSPLKCTDHGAGREGGGLGSVLLALPSMPNNWSAIHVHLYCWTSLGNYMQFLFQLQLLCIYCAAWSSSNL